MALLTIYTVEMVLEERQRLTDFGKAILEASGLVKDYELLRNAHRIEKISRSKDLGQGACGYVAGARGQGPVLAGVC
jgi:hypothetical protein